MSICTPGAHWTKIRPDARYCMGSELQHRIAACVITLKGTGDSKQKYLKQMANIHWNSVVLNVATKGLI